MKDKDFDLSYLKGGLKGIGYKLNSNLVLIGVLPALILVVIIIMQQGWQPVFQYTCNAPRCENPWHVDYLGGVNVENAPAEMLPYINQRWFENGFKVGRDPSPLFGWAYFLVIFGPAVMLVYNHFRYNRNWRRKK